MFQKLTKIVKKSNAYFSKFSEEDSTGQELMRITNELPRTAAPYPVKRVDRLVKLLNQWADRWIGAENGLIGFYEKDLVSNHFLLFTAEKKSDKNLWYLIFGVIRVIL